MNCPNCNAPEKAPVKVCRSCGEAFASQDLLELSQLEFLMAETATWDAVETQRSPYAERLTNLRARLQRRAPFKPEAKTEAALIPISTPVPAEPEPLPPSRPVPVARPAPPREQVPLDQWLLSERNIKIALYSGGLLLVLAGLIFIGVNWTRIPGPGKFGITMMVTGLMYLGGYLLFQRPALRPGGTALLGVASGFLTLNFAVLQIYVLGPSGLRDDVMWLIASPICLLLYVLTASWTRSKLFTYISVGAVGSLVTAALVVIDAPALIFVLAYSLLALSILFLAYLFKPTSMADFTHKPLLIVSQVGIIVVILAAIFAWVDTTGCISCSAGSPWLALLALGVGILFYLVTDVLLKWLQARWAAALLFPTALIFVLFELNFSDSAAGITMMGLSFAYMGLGHILERGKSVRAQGLPLYVMAYAVAAFVTTMSISEADDLAKILFGDVALLVISAAVHRSYRWVYGAVWLFILPIYLVINLNIPKLSNQGLLMGLLGLNYAVAGYTLGKRHLRLGGPFLTAAAFLSAVAVVLTWNEPLIAILVLVNVGLLYWLAAMWLNWPWLLFPVLLAANLAVFTSATVLFDDSVLGRVFIISYMALGAVLAFVGLALRRVKKAQWAWPLYVVCIIDLAGAYIGGLVLAGLLAIGVSATLAVLLFIFAWYERSEFIKNNWPPILSYLGIGTIFVGHFYVFENIGKLAWGVFPAYTAGLCALFVLLSALLRQELLTDIYGIPLRRAGLVLMSVPMAGAVSILKPIIGAVTFAIAGVTYVIDAVKRQKLNQAYLGIGSFVVVIWAVLMALDIFEPQAYVIPLGLVLLAVGWNGRLHGGGPRYRIPTLLGLSLLMGSAFIQSVPRGAYTYSLLLGIESLIAIGWGFRTRSRGFVQLGILAFFANAFVQLGPGFIDLPRWIQIGVTGSILLGGGMAALFKREELLATRQKLSDEWRQWQP